MNSFNLSQIREELSKIKDYDIKKIKDFESLKKEIKKLIAEIEKFDFKKSIPQDKLDYIERRYSEIMTTITALQSKVEKEVNSAVKTVSDGRNAAIQILTQTRDAAAKQKKDLEKLLQTNLKYFRKKARQSFKAEEKNLKKAVKKIRKTAVAKAKKTLTQSKKTKARN